MSMSSHSAFSAHFAVCSQVENDRQALPYRQFMTDHMTNMVAPTHLLKCYIQQCQFLNLGRVNRSGMVAGNLMLIALLCKRPFVTQSLLLHVAFRCHVLLRSVHQHDRLVMALHISMMVAADQGQLPREEWTVLSGHGEKGQINLIYHTPAWLPKDNWVHLHELLGIASCAVRCLQHVLLYLDQSQVILSEGPEACPGS